MAQSLVRHQRWHQEDMLEWALPKGESKKDVVFGICGEKYTARRDKMTKTHFPKKTSWTVIY